MGFDLPNSIPVGFILEATLAVLLLATIIYCAVLERRLSALRREQSGLAGTITTLNKAIVTAQASLAGLRAAAHEADETLGHNVREARKAASELGQLTQRMRAPLMREPARAAR